VDESPKAIAVAHVTRPARAIVVVVLLAGRQDAASLEIDLDRRSSRPRRSRLRIEPFAKRIAIAPTAGAEL
jgi:hypothetical protein